MGLRLDLLFTDEDRFGRISVVRSCWAPEPVRPKVWRQVVRGAMYALPPSRHWREEARR